ncbi:hypothetical protein [Chryseobacterium sp. EO14]|uniref:hypothetical protein n=1 Tax=Chryseobacterium sp. EO14 TaxID=2950551 RepID=UPI00210BA79D|nr:hypothetical protein [Chryseobacterium sp. EO14]MCQ4142485.1 hypothetical protein [Chryseobacterium sp. EO14]
MRKHIFFFTLMLFTNIFNSQVLEAYTPILVVNNKEIIFNNKKVDEVSLDYYTPNENDLIKDYFRYDSDACTLYYFDKKEKRDKIFLSLKPNEVKFTKHKLGAFEYFDLIREDKNNFKALPSYGVYPSHTLQIKSVEILSQTKKNLILKFNYLDIFAWKSFGVLIFKDYKYEHLKDDE